METTVSLAKELKMTKENIIARARSLGFTKTGKIWKFTDFEADMICDYQPKPSFKDKYHKRKISIIEFFMSNSNNTRLDMSRKMDLPMSRIDITINEWCDNDHFIIVESKINTQCIE